MRKYKLLKDLPDANAGDIYVREQGSDTYHNEYTLTQKSPVLEHNCYFSWQVEKNPSWFEEIKEPSKENKEWEIVSFLKDGKLLEQDKYKWKYRNEFNSISDIGWLIKFCTIHSVKRLSDNQVFSVGDEVTSEYFTSDSKWRGIVKFEVNGERMEVRQIGGVSQLKDLSRRKPPSNKQEPKEDVFMWTDNEVKNLMIGVIAGFTRGEYQFSYGNEMDEKIKATIQNFKQSKQPLPDKEERAVVDELVKQYTVKGVADILGLYTQQDLENAFEAGRKKTRHLGYPDYPKLYDKFPTFTDYINSLHKTKQ